MIIIPTEPSAKVVADSISPAGDRLISVQATGHRFILAEVNTHSVLVRSSASSRAIPLAKQLKKVTEDAAVPVIWASEQKGMQGGEELEPHLCGEADRIWYDGVDSAVETAQALGEIGVHKSIANRVLEPFLWHTMLITGTAWQNMFDQRVHPDAQPEFQAMATAIKEAIDASEPRELKSYEWHLPYITDMDMEIIRGNVGAQMGDESEVTRWAVSVSVARCARNSYETHDGKRDLNLDMDLYNKLTTERFEKGDVPHWTPLEHVAVPSPGNRQQGVIEWTDSDSVTHRIDLSHLPKVGRLLGWMSHRHFVESQQGVVTFR